MITWIYPGHIILRDKENVARKVLGNGVEGYKRKGRPKTRWIDCVKEDLGTELSVK